MLRAALDTLGEFLPGFLLRGRQRFVGRASHRLIRRRRLARTPVLDEFG